MDQTYRPEIIREILLCAVFHHLSNAISWPLGRLSPLIPPSTNLLRDLEIEVQAFFPRSKMHAFVNWLWRGKKNVLKIDG